MGAGWEFRIKRETKEVGGEAKRGRCPGWEVNLFSRLFLLMRKYYSFLEPVICRWVKGAREGQGTVSTLNLEEVNFQHLKICHRQQHGDFSNSVHYVPMMTLVVRAGGSESYHGELRLGSAGGPGQDGDG